MINRIIAFAAALTAWIQVDAHATPSNKESSMDQKPVSHLVRPGGRIAWSLHGSTGPLVVGMPGMGDLRTHWDGFAAALANRGYRVAVLDLRGHGLSDTGFADVSREAIANDALALADSLSPHDPAILIGHSYTGASAVWAATEHSERVRAIVLLDPFAREVQATWFQKFALKFGLLRPWGHSVWASYYASLFPVHPPADLAERKRAVGTNLREPGRLESLRAMGRTNAATCEAKLDSVQLPTLILFGLRDPDFPDPAAEGNLLAARTKGRFEGIPEAGHYPHEEDPTGVAGRIAGFLDSLPEGASVTEVAP